MVVAAKALIRCLVVVFEVGWDWKRLVCGIRNEGGLYHITLEASSGRWGNVARGNHMNERAHGGAQDSRGACFQLCLFRWSKRNAAVDFTDPWAPPSVPGDM